MSLKKQLGLFVLILVTAFATGASAQTKKPAAKKAAKRVFFIEPKNGDTVSSPVHMKFGSEGENHSVLVRSRGEEALLACD